MNKFLTLVLSFALAAGAVSCQLGTDDVTPDDPDTNKPTPTRGDVTPVATPIGEVVTATIGPAGGHIESADQRLRVEIPAGALTNNQTISVQALDKNHCPGGTGTAFRLLPHGLTFAKPATISFNYDNGDLDGSASELLRIAYQHDDHGWYSPATAHLDTTEKLIAAHTTHFSDWTILKSIGMDPLVDAVDPGESTKLSLRFHVDVIEDTGLVLAVVKDLDTKFIKKWSLQGAGHLSENGTNHATYTAPDRIPATNPAVVTVALSAKINNVQREVRLKSRIFTLGEGIVFRINNGPWIPTTSPLGLSKINRGANQYMTVQTGLSAPGLFASVTLSWPVSKEVERQRSYSLPWRLKTDKNELEIPVIYLSTNPTGQPLYTFFYEQSKQAYPSPGELRIDKNSFENNREIIGSFTLKKAGFLHYSGGTDPVFDGTAQIDGYFRLKVAREL